MPAKKSSHRRSDPDPQHPETRHPETQRPETQRPEDPTGSDSEKDSGRSADDFVQAAEASQGGLLEEFWLFLRESKKWWLTPIILVLLLLAGLVVLAGTGAAPFIYTLF